MARKERTWTDKQLEDAKSMYMEYTPTVHIAEATKVPRTTINYYIEKSWKVERAIEASELMGAIAEGRAEAIATLSGTALKIMNRALKGVMKSKETPTLRQALDAGKVLDTIERIAGLDAQKEREEGKSNDDKLNPNQLVKEMQKDPFFKPAKEENDEDSTKLN